MKPFVRVCTLFSLLGMPSFSVAQSVQQDMRHPIGREIAIAIQNETAKITETFVATILRGITQGINMTVQEKIAVAFEKSRQKDRTNPGASDGTAPAQIQK